MAIELETERLRMRQWRLNDFEPYAEFLSDPATADFVGGVCTREEAWDVLAKQAGHMELRGYGMWVLEEKTTGSFVGYCGLWYPLGWPEIEMGWGLLKAHHGRGLATEAARRVRDFAYQTLQLSTLVSYTSPDNKASRRLAERLGARFETTIQLAEFGEAAVYRYPSPTKTKSQSTTEN